MGIEELFVWYQRKIGTYDKQQWETKIEQRERRIYGLNHIQMRSTKPNTELIDLDLVRGSSFTKAKPQHGIIKVAKLATVRCLFVPLYKQWWIRQTSRSVFFLTLIIYISLIFNIIIYVLHVSRCTADTEAISCMELVIPLIIMWILSLIHSQIVATNPILEEKKKNDLKTRHFRRRRSNVRPARTRLDCKDSAQIKKIRKKLKFNDTITVERVTTSNLRSHLNHKRHIDDDGFESLNGNGSRTSEEEAVPMETSQIKNEVGDKPNLQLEPQVDESQDLQVIEESIITVSKVVGMRNINACETIFEKHNEDGEESSETRCKNCDSVQGMLQTCDARSRSESDRSSNCNTCKKCENWVKQIPDVQEMSEIPGTLRKECTTDSESEHEALYCNIKKEHLATRRNSHIPTINITSTIDGTCDTEDEILSSPETGMSGNILGNITPSTEYIGVTTNSEDCSLSSDIEDVSDANMEPSPDYFCLDDTPDAPVLNPPSIKASCTIWENDEIKKADLTMLDISSAIIGKVDAMNATMDYFYIGVAFSTVIAFLPLLCRLFGEQNLILELYKNVSTEFLVVENSTNLLDVYRRNVLEIPSMMNQFLEVTLGNTVWERIIMVIALLQRWVLASMVFFLLSVAERTFKQRLLYAKLFSHLTSSRRARKSELPHFRLNKVRNIKTWLSVRSYLKRRGPQRSVDVIVSTAFIVTLLLLTFVCVELLKDTVSYSQYYLEALIWSLGLGILLLRFMTLGTKINKKYRNHSVLIIEQINLHLQIEQKPHKKEELTVANNVLKLAIDLLKELENPFKISGLSANPILYNVTKLVILSALSGVLSEMLGFKLKLHKIKLK